MIKQHLETSRESTPVFCSNVVGKCFRRYDVNFQYGAIRPHNLFTCKFMTRLQRKTYPILLAFPAPDFFFFLRRHLAKTQMFPNISGQLSRKRKAQSLPLFRPEAPCSRNWKNILVAYIWPSTTEGGMLLVCFERRWRTKTSQPHSPCFIPFMVPSVGQNHFLQLQFLHRNALLNSLELNNWYSDTLSMLTVVC